MLVSSDEADGADGKEYMVEFDIFGTNRRKWSDYRCYHAQNGSSWSSKCYKWAIDRLMFCVIIIDNKCIFMHFNIRI